MLAAFATSGLIGVGRFHVQRLVQSPQSGRVIVAGERRRLANRSNTTTTRSLTSMATGDGKKRILVAIANGSEEIETASAVDTFVRAGADVTLASVEDSTTVTMSRGMKFVADALVEDVKGPFDAVALPGGMPGAERLRDSEKLISVLKDTASSGGVVAAVCASPAVVFGSHGLLDGKKATCFPHPNFRSVIKNLGDGDVVVDGNMITGTGPGTSLKWALTVVQKMYGKAMAQQLAGEMQAEFD